MGAPSHLARRFTEVAWPAGPRPADEAWARSQLLPGEQAVWDAMAPADRRHAVGVARRVIAALGSRATRPVVAAALLHDCGKATSGLGALGRTVATVEAIVRGREQASAGEGRRARYLRHDELGAAALAAAGSDGLTVTWAREHHRPREVWTLPLDVAFALKAADDD